MSVADAIEAASPEIVARSVEAMYENPFWKDRFGTRGERHSRDDHAHHVRYLVEALRAGRPAILEDYARWLQKLLTTRGMCTLHVEESLTRVADAIACAKLDPTNVVDSFVRAAASALLYTSNDARAAQQAAEPLAERARSQAIGEAPADMRDRMRAATDDVRYLVAYAADAMALEDPRVLDAYVTWRAGFLERHQMPRHAVARLLAGLESASTSLGRSSPPFAELVRNARTTLERGAS